MPGFQSAFALGLLLVFAVPLARAAPAPRSLETPSPAQASSAGCDIAGQFQKGIFDLFGERFATHETSYGLAIVDPKSGDILCEEYVQGDRVIYPASTMKTLVALAVLRKVDLGALKLDQDVAISQVNAGEECSHWDCRIYGPGKLRSVRELLWDAITISNNIAANQLIDLATKPWIEQTAQDVGARNLHVYRKVYDDVDPEPNIHTPNTATARDYIALYREIATGRMGLLSTASRELLIEILAHQKYNGSLNGDFPEGVTFYHKTGDTSQVTGDAGFYYLPSGKIAILAGLQDFNRYRVCHDGDCFWTNGFRALRMAGKRTYDLVQRGVGTFW
jgi:beta-lactamase class A